MTCNPAVFWQTGVISAAFFKRMKNLGFTGFSGEGVQKRRPIWAYFREGLSMIPKIQVTLKKLYNSKLFVCKLFF